MNKSHPRRSPSTYPCRPHWLASAVPSWPQATRPPAAASHILTHSLLNLKFNPLWNNRISHKDLSNSADTKQLGRSIKLIYLKMRLSTKSHSISNRNFCCFSYIIDMVNQNSPTVEFWQEKIEGNLRRANTEPSVDIRRANTEPSVDFRKVNTEPSVHFRRANTETY